MKNLMPRPCPQWEKQLATCHADDLAPSERAALAQHLLSCSACRATLDAYGEMDQAIRSLPPVLPLASLPEQVMQLHEEQGSVHTGQKAGLDETGRHKTRRSSAVGRALRVMELIAAVIMVGAVIGGALLLFKGHRATRTATEEKKSGPCLFVEPGVPVGGITGRQQICNQHLYTDLHITRNIGRYPVTLEQAYADSAQIIIMLTLPGNIDRQFPQVAVSDFVTAPGLKMGAGAQGTWLRLYQGKVVAYSFVEIRQVLGNPQKLTVHYQAFGISLVNKQGGYRDITGPFAVDFTLPFHAGRQVSIHQTQTIEGKSVTLESLLLAPSGLRLTYHSSPDFNTWLYTDIFIKVPGLSKPIYLFSSDESAMHISPFDGASLFDKHGEWTITFQHLPALNAKATNWVFRVDVP
jgi:hypothetical protein